MRVRERRVARGRVRRAVRERAVRGDWRMARWPRRGPAMISTMVPAGSGRVGVVDEVERGRGDWGVGWDDVGEERGERVVWRVSRDSQAAMKASICGSGTVRGMGRSPGEGVERSRRNFRRSSMRRL